MPKKPNKVTSPKVASDAGKLLAKPGTPKKIKELAASLVSQAAPKKKSK